LYTELPVVWLVPTANRKRQSEEFYSCPVFRTLARAGAGTVATTGQSANFVMTMDIPSKEEEKVWIKQGVACVLALDD
jgi:dynein heavy chain